MWWLTGAKIVWSILSGGGLSGVVKEIAGYLGKANDNKTQVELGKIGAETTIDVAALNAHVAEYHEAVDLAKYRWGWWGERYLLLAAALPPIIHSGAIYLDSTFRFGWGIAKAPGVYEGQELKIIASVCGYSVARAGVAALIGRVAGKGGQ